MFKDVWFLNTSDWSLLALLSLFPCGLSCEFAALPMLALCRMPSLLIFAISTNAFWYILL